jgi:hypothetical protein
VTYLAAQSVGTAGTDLFEGGFHETPDTQIAVAHFGGEASERQMGPSLGAPVLEMPLVLVLARSPSKATAEAKARAAYVKLDNLQGMTSTGGVVYHHVESLDGPPASMEQDENLRWVYGATYRVRKAAG